jgi:hypothetical protein
MVNVRLSRSFARSLGVASMLLAAFAFAAPQDGEPKISEKSRRAHEYRMVNTSPSYDLAKVKAIVRKIKPDDEGSKILNPKVFDKMPLEEKFTYTLVNREWFSQNCDEMPIVENEDKKIFAYLPAEDDMMDFSDHEQNFLKNNRGRVIPLLSREIEAHPHVGLNVKSVVVYLDAYELIPDIVKAYQRNPRDLDLLTVLDTLMKDGKYAPFMQSITYKKLYGTNADYKTYVDGNKANAKLTMDRAMAFYNSRKG